MAARPDFDALLAEIAQGEDTEAAARARALAAGESPEPAVAAPRRARWTYLAGGTGDALPAVDRQRATERMARLERMWRVIQRTGPDVERQVRIFGQRGDELARWLGADPAEVTALLLSRAECPAAARRSP